MRTLHSVIYIYIHILKTKPKPHSSSTTTIQCSAKMDNTAHRFLRSFHFTFKALSSEGHTRSTVSQITLCPSSGLNVYLPRLAIKHPCIPVSRRAKNDQCSHLREPRAPHDMYCNGQGQRIVTLTEGLNKIYRFPKTLYHGFHMQCLIYTC